MMFNAVNAQIKKMLATASDTRLSPREMEKSKHDVYFVKQYSIGKRTEFIINIIKKQYSICNVLC